MSKVKIELTPYDALTILSFLREYDYTIDPQLKALGQAVNSYEASMAKNISSEQIEDAKAENRVNQLIGKSPDREEQERLGLI